MADSAELLQQLRATLGKMEVALNAIPEAIIWTDARGRIQWCNSACDRLLGRSHLDILGAYLTELLPLARHGQLLDDKQHPVVHMLQNPSVVSADDYELRVMEPRPVIQLSGSCFHMGDADRGLVLVIRDITERRLMEETLRNEKQELIRANQVMMGREERVLELKQRVNTLLQELGRPSEYRVS